MSSRSSAAYIAVVALLTAGCAFEPGQPWGVAQFDFAATFDPPASRLEEGALKTAKDYRVDLDTFEIEFDVVEVEIASDGEVTEFDPAEPPEGFSLCHGGHCHSDDGRLVPYDEIEAEASAGDLVIIQSVEATPIAMTAAPSTVALGACTNDCQLQPGALSLVRLRLRQVHVAGTVTDARDRIEATAFDATFGVDVELTEVIEARIGKGEPGQVRIDLSYEAPPELFDGVDFETTPADEPLSTEAVEEVLEEHSIIDVSVEQTELN